MHKLAVIGNPIEHSLSPVIWQLFADSLNIKLDYQKILSTPESFELDVKQLFTTGVVAMSVTAPFKAQAYKLADIHNEHTLACKTGNLLINNSAEIIIDNTDGVGLIEDIKLNNMSLENKNVLFIGNGSVIHSVLSAIEAESPSCVHMLMRNYENIIEFKKRSAIVDKYTDAIFYDIVINTTPNTPENSLFSQVKRLIDGALAYDMIYTKANTLFMQTMKQGNSNIITINGIGMLIQQAKVAFEKVFNQTPDVSPVYKFLEERYK